MKILNVVENLDKGAVENWLVQTFIESQSLYPQWEWTFYCILNKKGRLDELVLTHGGKIIYSPFTISNKIKFLLSLRHVLKKNKYDIIHSHHDYLSGFYGLSTIGIPFKKKLLHIHNTDEVIPVGNNFLKKILLPIFGYLALAFNDVVIGVSKHTLDVFLNGKKKFCKKSDVLYCGVNFTSFLKPVDKNFLKKELDIPLDAKIILFVGRMNELKNPSFIIDILNYILLEKPNTYAIFIGEGGEKEKIIQKAEINKTEKFIRLLGWRNDVQAIMQSADVFIFPRLEHPKEALGLVIVEAQAAGLPLVISRAIVEDAIIIKNLAFYTPLDNNAQEWANTILYVLSRGTIISRESAYKLMSESKFDLRNATLNLIKLYTS